MGRYSPQRWGKWDEASCPPHCKPAILYREATGLDLPPPQQLLTTKAGGFPGLSFQQIPLSPKLQTHISNSLSIRASTPAFQTPHVQH